MTVKSAVCSLCGGYQWISGDYVFGRPSSCTCGAGPYDALTLHSRDCDSVPCPACNEEETDITAGAEIDVWKHASPEESDPDPWYWTLYYAGERLNGGVAQTAAEAFREARYRYRCAVVGGRIDPVKERGDASSSSAA